MSEIRSRKITILKWSAVGMLIALAASVIILMRMARTGESPMATYYAYRSHLLGDVNFHGCTIKFSGDYFPKLTSYESLSVDETEVGFVDVESDKMDGKPGSISFVRRNERLSDRMLGPVERVGSLNTRFAITGVTAKVVAWLPDQELYAGARDMETLRKGLSAASISCAPKS